MRVLTLGMSGDDVARWERFLVRARHLQSTPAGFFGPSVATATEAFQADSGLAANGRADGPTLAAALGQGLLDAALDGPQAPAAVPKEAGWTAKAPFLVAVAAAVGTFGTSLVVELFKNHANIAAEREKLRSALIQQAMQVPNGWSRGDAQLEVTNRLRVYVQLGLVELPPGTVDRLLENFANVPVLASGAPQGRVAVPSTPPPVPPQAPSGTDPVATVPGLTADRQPGVTGTQRVFIQFAGDMPRADVIGMARALSADWQVQGAKAGGERIGTAAGRKEVRWGDPSDEEAAKALADAVERTGIVLGEVTTARVASIRRGNLEIWISR